LQKNAPENVAIVIENDVQRWHMSFQVAMSRHGKHYIYLTHVLRVLKRNNHITATFIANTAKNDSIS